MGKIANLMTLCRKEHIEIMNKIVECISSFLCMLRRHGMLGKKQKIRYFFAGRIDAEWVTNSKHNTNEFIKTYQIICEQYVEIRMHVLWTSNRIGEYVPRYLVAVDDSKKNAEKGVLDVFVLENYVNDNSRLTTVMGRNIHIIDKKNVNMWMYILSRFPKVEFQNFLGDYSDRNRKIFIDPKRTAECFLLTSEEEEEVRKKKESMGLLGSFVCVSSRDDTYLNTILPNLDSSHHNYRNTDINNLALSADYLSNKGIITVRMGRYVKEKVKFGNCIDYANDFYDELMDIALMRDCKFFVGDSNGLCVLPMVFNVPCALKNVVPVFSAGWGAYPQNPQNLYIFKKYYSKTKKRFLSLKEMMEVDRIAPHGHDITEKHAELNVEVIENSAEEILDLVMEMNARIDGEWIETKEDIELQNKYQRIRKQWYKEKRYSENSVLQAKVGALFLRKNPFLLD